MDLALIGTSFFSNVTLKGKDCRWSETQIDTAQNRNQYQDRGGASP